ncbi:retrovirus-related pol polyprotein from transposon TNT 1-94 [Tanacetum coccineum]
MQETVSKFFHIFVLFATSVRDGENLDKMKKKVMVLCIFCGYLLSQRLTGSDPAPQCPTTVLEHDSLSPGPQSQENVPQVDETVTTSTFPLKLFNKSYFPTKVPMSVAPENIIQAETNSRTIRLARIRWRDVYVALSQLYQFDRLDVWELVDMPLCKNVINLKWLWKNKRDEENTVIRNKSRLVAKGYAQKEGIDFERVIFAPVFRVRSCTVSSLEKKCTYTKTDGFCSGPYHPEKFLVSRKHYIGIKQAPRACMMNSPTSWDSDSSIPRGIFINQAKYAQEILKKHGMTSCDSIGTPMATKNTLDADLSGTLVDQTKYRSMVGALMYLTARSPGSNYTFSEIRIHARCLDSRKSTSGGIQILGGDSYQVLWLRTQLTDYGFHFDKIPMYCDSKAAIAISCNPVQHSYTKHIDVRYHFIKEKGRMPTKIELTLEQSQQSVSNDVLILRFEAGNPVRDSLNLHDSHGIVFILLKGETRAQVDQGSQIKMIQVKEMMQDNDLKNLKSKDKGSKSRSQSMDEQSHYKQDKTITRQSINVKRHIFNVIGGTEEFEERDLNIGGDFVIQNTCFEKEDSNSETASSKLVKECSLNSETKDVHAIKYKMSKAKERCMAYFRSLHSHLQVLSKADLKGTHVEHGFRREFMSIFGQDVDTFTSTMLLNVHQLQKQLDKDKFQEDGSMAAFWVVQHFRDTLLQHLANVKNPLLKETVIKDRKSIGQTQTVKMMQQVQGMIKMIDDADIRPIYDEEPMAKGRVDQYPETCQVKSPMLDSSPDNQTTEYSKQSLESKTTEQTTSLLANNAELKAQIQEKVFAIAALKNDLRKLKGNSVDTKFDKTSVLGKPVLPSLRNQSVVRQPHAFKSAWAQMSKQRYINQCLEGTTSIDYVQVTLCNVTRKNLQSMVAEKDDISETIVKVDSQMMIQNNDVCSQQFRPRSSMSNDV